MTFLQSLVCTACSAHHDPSKRQTVCTSCGKVLAATYDLETARRHLRRESFDTDRQGMMKYEPLLPILHRENLVSLGEQTTPLLRLDRLGEELGIENLWMKDEGQLPTGSFKSRGLAVAVSKAKELGVTSICIPSAGNAAGAAAAYAAKAGMECWIFIPEDTPAMNIKECAAYGAHIELVQGNISDAAKRMAELKTVHPDWFDVSTLKEPYRLEGKKTMGYELVEQFGWTLPDVILYPTGGGTGLIGMWKAFDEMEKLGWIGRNRPRMVSVQSDGCAPIVKAFETRARTSEFWNNAATCASGLRVPKPFADYLILDVLYKSAGLAVAVPDNRIQDAIKKVAQREGVLLCPEGATAILALEVLARDGTLKPKDRVVIFNTATGLKYPEVLP
ncbi:MAG: threonine synthase [Ignavibacteriales bacterium]|nr:threonine synthase [Ignavibacteriales bacterium]